MKQELLHHVNNQSKVRTLFGFGLFNRMAKSLKFALLSLVFIFGGLVFGTQDVQAGTYPSGQTVYVESSSYYSAVKLYAWGGTYSTPSWCGETMTSLGLIGSKYYWSITLNGTFTSMIVCDNSCNKISGTTDGVASDGTTTNCITVTGDSYSWKLFNCTSYSDCPSNVLTGTNVMFYINQSYGGTLGITNNSSSSCIANGTDLGNNNAYINMAKASVPGTMSVSNNCDGWVGTGAFSRSTAYNAGNYFVTGASTSNTSATTASLSASSTSIAAGTSSINITSTAGSVNSSFGKKLAIQYYISTTKYGCDFANTSGVATTINTSSLSQGTYKIKSVLTDGTIYYLGDSINLYVTPSPFTFGTINRTSCTTANLAWSANAPALLVRYEGSSPSITNPTHGQSYSSGNTIGAGTVVYSGTSDNYTATFDADKIYTFVIYRVSASGYLYSTSASTTLAAGVPALTTATATSVGGTVATLGGNISSKGAGGAILSRGIEWTATVGGKTAGNREEIDKTDATGAFSKEFTGLTGSTTYKYKAYATNNSCETSYGYGAEESFTTSTSCSTPSSNFAASGTYNSGDWTTRFANDYRTASLSTNQVADAYLWECTSANSSKVSIASNTSKTTNATFDLPGEYTFRVGAKCTLDGGYTYSETVTVNVPYPEIGISGPFYDGDWHHTKAGTDGKFSRSGLVYTKDFTVNTSSGEFVIIQAYKLGCDANDGWAGYQECSSISGSNGNKINCSTLSTSTINKSSCGNFTQNAGLSNSQTARLTVTMTAYDSYTMLLELACTPPTGGTATATASSVCSGSGTTITLTGNTGTIQWQSSTNGTDYSDISGATSSTLSTGNLTVKTWYRAVVTSGSCSSNSSAAEVTIKTSPVISAISGSATTTQYKPETYTASGSNLGTLTWAIVDAPAHANISATTGSSTVFKAKDGSYTLSVTATNDGCTDNETKGITVSTDSETCP